MVVIVAKAKAKSREKALIRTQNNRVSRSMVTFYCMQHE